MDKSGVLRFLRENKLHPLKKWGQNFLIHQPTLHTIVKTVKKYPSPYVEIGPGPGVLSRLFKKQEITLIERDKKLVSCLQNTGYFVLCADALKLEWKSLPARFTLFGNLPYNIVSGVILKACKHQAQIQNMVLMMQKQLAQRVMAKPCSKNYGLLSVISQTFWNVRLIGHVEKTCFYPCPKVDGSVLRWQAKKQNIKAACFLVFVKNCFSFKRKMLFKQVSGVSPDAAKYILKSLNLSENCRAEELSYKQFTDLYLLVKKHIRCV